MKKIFIYISILLHIILIIISLFKFNDVFKNTIKDNGYAVFDFVSIGNKSTAPVLSKENGKTSKIKSYNTDDNKEENIINKQNDNTEQVPDSKSENKKDDNKKQLLNNKTEEKKQDNIKEKKEKTNEKKENVTKIKENKTTLTP